MATPALATSEVTPVLSPWQSFLAWLFFRNQDTPSWFWSTLVQNALLAMALVAGAVTAFLASTGFDNIGWDSAGLLFRVITVVAAVGSVVILLPSVFRRIVISLVILFHFGGILSSVTSVSPSPWIATRLWTVVFRPYLNFLYMSNAYHFYSPEPGPAHLLYFCIEYEEDPPGTRNFRWVFEPDLERESGVPYDPDGTRIWSKTEYTRRLSLAENAGMASTFVSPSVLELLMQRRLIAGRNDEIPPFPTTDTGSLFAGIPLAYQYREPAEIQKRWIQAYVRHVAHTYKHEKPDLKVIGVKFYLVVHNFIFPKQLAAGIDPNDRRLYRPYFFGDFNPDGTMKETCQKTLVREDGSYDEDYRSRDPYLYWLIPLEDVVKHAEGRDGTLPGRNPLQGDDE